MSYLLCNTRVSLTAANAPPQAFLFVHSLGGGTGSGLGTKCLESKRVPAWLCCCLLFQMITGFYDDEGFQRFVTKRSVFCAVMADLHPQLGRFACVVSPGDTDDVITSPYNAALALEKLHQYATCVLPLCNDSLTQVSKLRSRWKPVKLLCI